MLSLDWVDSEPQESTNIHILSAGIKDVWTTSPDFSVSAEDTNSDPHTFVANAFQEDPLSQATDFSQRRDPPFYSF